MSVGVGGFSRLGNAVRVCIGAGVLFECSVFSEARSAAGLRLALQLAAGL